MSENNIFYVGSKYCIEDTNLIYFVTITQILSVLVITSMLFVQLKNIKKKIRQITFMNDSKPEAVTYSVFSYYIVLLLGVYLAVGIINNFILLFELSLFGKYGSFDKNVLNQIEKVTTNVTDYLLQFLFELQLFEWMAMLKIINY